MKEWEYEVKPWAGTDSAWLGEYLNEKGKDGWEVVSVNVGESNKDGTIVLKRIGAERPEPVPTATKPEKARKR